VSAADGSLELARTLRKALTARDEAIGVAMAAFDTAVSERERWEAAAMLLLAIDAADKEYTATKARAVAALDEREAA
jgi:hypothetical protein